MYVGAGASLLDRILTAFFAHRVIHYNPHESSLACYNEETKRIGKRLALVERAKSAPVFGLLLEFHDSSTRKFVAAALECTRLLHKHVHVFSIGKINQPKLANFSDVGAYVYLGCPDQFHLVKDSSHVPLLTPFEFCLALSNAYPLFIDGCL